MARERMTSPIFLNSPFKGPWLSPESQSGSELRLDLYSQKTRCFGGFGCVTSGMESPFEGTSSIERLAADPCSRHSALKSPILVFLFFHKAIRGELQRLHEDALAIEKGSHREIQTLLDRYHFLRAIYQHHSNAEDEVIFPALDKRVKNVALTYSLEHKGENDLFDQVFELLNSVVEHKDKGSSRLRRELVCCTEAIQTSVCQHMSKEEEQVLPLLTQHFSCKEQASLVWQFMCSIPVTLMEEFLSWLALSLPTDEQKLMIKCMRKIVPEENILQEVVFTWLKKRSPPIDFKGIIGSNNKNLMFCSEEPDHAKTRAAAKTGPNSQGSEVHECCKEMCKNTHSVVHIVNENASELLKFPINEILHWHYAIRKEFKEIAEEVQSLQHSGVSSNLSSFNDRFEFFAEVCIFYSVAGDKVVRPAVAQKINKCVSFISKCAQEESLINSFRHFIESVRNARGSLTTSEAYNKLCAQGDILMETIEQRFVNEEFEVLPLVRTHCSIEEQRSLLYQILRVMPLKFLERVLPWLVATLSEEEAKDMMQNIQLAAPVADTALVALFSAWACKGYLKNVSKSGKFTRISSSSSNDSSLENINEMASDLSKSCGGCAMKSQTQDDCRHSSTEIDERPLKRPYSSKVEQEGSAFDQSIPVDLMRKPGIPCVSQSCCASLLGVNNNDLGMAVDSTGRHLHYSTVNSSLCSSLFGWGLETGSPDIGQAPKPIDHIFQFHKAIRKDLEYLDVESVRLMDCNDTFLRQFSGRFCLLWGLYRAHSNAEDEIVFPALEAKEALHNVSHSYTIDHKQEEKLFRNIFTVLSELAELHKDLTVDSLSMPSSAGVVQPRDQISKCHELSAKLQCMFKSMRVALDQHLSREEIELWPLFGVHFSIEEQDRIVGRIIGTTGAEVLQTMLPWVTTALTQEEQSTMIDTWRQASRNTMFDEWLSAWWKESPMTTPESSLASEDHAVLPSGTAESLKMVADYLCRDDEKCHMGEERTNESNHVTETDTSDRESISFENISEDHSASKTFGGTEIHENKDSGCMLVPSVDVKQDNAEVGEIVEQQIEQRNQKFKPGWQDIFRMNQEELESAIRKVSRDNSLDPRRKAYLIQNLVTSRWIAAQQKLQQSTANNLSNGKDIPGWCPSYHDADQNVLGCQHYRRNCKLVAACCGQLFTCRFCHDEVSDHLFDRKATREMMCMKCLHIQPVSPNCATPSCEGLSMARYFCSICKFFDDKRNIYHCPFCNLCRVGKGLGIDYFHCMNCNACMSKTLSAHKCWEKSFESNCPICHDFIFSSSATVKGLPCGHFMHSACFQAYTCYHYTCPICSKSLGDMDVYFGMLDALLAAEKLPEEYQGRTQDIICHDCEMKGTSPFHWLYHKCSTCGSYNTRVT